MAFLGVIWGFSCLPRRRYQDCSALICIGLSQQMMAHAHVVSQAVMTFSSTPQLSQHST